MKGTNRTLLKLLINDQFGKGINKVDLFNALEVFIDKHYPPERNHHYFTEIHKKQLLTELLVDIREAGGVKLWKEKLQPKVIRYPNGMVMPTSDQKLFKNKKQEQHHQDQSS